MALKFHAIRDLGLGHPRCNLGNLWRRMGLLRRVKSWSLTSLQHRLMKTGGRLVRPARCYWVLLADEHLDRRLFAARLAALAVPGG